MNRNTFIYYELFVNERFQSKIEAIVTALGGKHKGCPWKGDSRMRNKAVAEDDHRNEPKPRPALNIDIVRCCVTFDDVESLKKGIDAINLGFQNGESGILLAFEPPQNFCP